MSNQTSIKYPGTTTSTSKVHINNMYIKYTFDVTGLLICQVFGAVAFPVTSSLAVETHSVRLRTIFGFLLRIANRFATLLEFSLLCLSLLETIGLINHQHLMFLFDVHFRRFQHREKLRD